MLIKDSRPNITDHKIIFKGNRFWIFEVDKNHPYQGYDDYSDIVIFDRRHMYAIGCSTRDSKKSNSYEFNGFWVSPINDGEEFHCNGVNELRKLIKQRANRWDRLTIQNKYTPPELNGHKILYKGKRYWVFEISKENPFENMEDVCSIIVYDKLCGGIAGYFDYTKDRKIIGSIPFSQQSIEIGGDGGREIAGQVDYWTKWIERTEK